MGENKDGKGKRRKKKEKPASGGDIVVGFNGFGLTFPLQVFLQFFFAEKVARFELIAGLTQNAKKKIAANKTPSPEERYALNQVLGPQFREEMNVVAIAARAEEIYVSESKLLSAAGAMDAPPVMPSQAWRDRFRLNAGPDSEPDVQEMWAQLLAKEGRKPGSFSFKTLSVLRDLEPQDARAFVTLLSCRFGPDGLPGLKTFSSEYLKLGLNYDAMLRLAEVGLIHHDDARVQFVDDDPEAPHDILCVGLVIRLPRPNTVIDGRPMTIAGEQLAKITDCPPRLEAVFALFEWLCRSLGIAGSDVRVALRDPDGRVTTPFRQWEVTDFGIDDAGQVYFRT